jgi:hypothetical protein
MWFGAPAEHAAVLAKIGSGTEMRIGYNFWRCVKDRMREVHAASDCVLKPRCTTGKERRITRWERERVLEAVQKRLDQTRTPRPAS